MPTPTLLQQIAAGDRDAVAKCLDRYGGLVWTLARRMTPKGDDPEDAVQEIFIEIWKHANRFDPQQAEESVFIAMIARRRLIDRRRKVDRAPGFSSIDEVVEPSSKYASADASTDVAIAAKAMGELKPEQQRMLTMSLQLGLSHGEIAEVTNTAVGTVKSNLRRGLIALRDKLSPATKTRRKA